MASIDDMPDEQTSLLEDQMDEVTVAQAQATFAEQPASTVS